MCPTNACQVAVCEDKPSDDAARRRSETFRELQVNAAGFKCERRRSGGAVQDFRITMRIWPYCAPVFAPEAGRVHG